MTKFIAFIFISLFLSACAETVIASRSTINFNLPPVGKDTVEVKVHRFATGYSDSKEALVYSEGSWFKNHRSAHAAFLLEHPKESILVESGLGRNVDKQYQEMSWFHRLLLTYVKEKSVVDTLPLGHKIKRMIITHLHWDHASAIEDFPDLSVYVAKEEKMFALSKEATIPAYIKSQYMGHQDRLKELVLNNKEYGPFKQHIDLLADGSIVIVPIKGHSPGSIGILVNSNLGRLFFVGDAIWTNLQLKEASSKPWAVSMFVDQDREKTRETILLLKELVSANPELKIVPTHDFENIKYIPKYGE